MSNLAQLYGDGQSLFSSFLRKGNFHHLVAAGIHILARKNDVVFSLFATGQI